MKRARGGPPANLAGSLKMLVLTRRTGETIRIGDTVAVTLLEVKGNQARIGIEAPREIVVDREEVYLRKQQESAARKQQR